MRERAEPAGSDHPHDALGPEVLHGGERGQAPCCIRTLHGQGYRFVASVQARLDTPPGTAPPAALRACWYCAP